MKTADHIDRAASTADGLAGRLSERRRARGLTQGQVAVRLGVSRQAVSKWEMGRSAPDLENLALLAELFSCTVDELLIGDAEAPDGAPREARPADAADGHGRTGADGRAPSEAASRQVGPTPSETERIARDNRCIVCSVMVRGALIGLELTLVSRAGAARPDPYDAAADAALWVAVLLCTAVMCLCTRYYARRGGSPRASAFDAGWIMLCSIVPVALGPTPPVLAACAALSIACAFCSMRTIIWHLRYQRAWDPLEDLGDPLGRRPH